MKLASRRSWVDQGWLDFQGTGLLRVVALLAMLALFVGACGGNGDDGGDGVTPTGAADATGATGTTGTTGGPTGAGGGATGSTGSTAGGGSTGSGDVTGGAPADIADLAGLESFRWDVTLSGTGASFAGAAIPSIPGGGDASEFAASGSWIAPDQAQVEITLAGFAYKQTIKGSEQWTTIAGVTTGPVPATDSAASLIYVSAFIDPTTVVDGSSMQCGGSENVNGVDAVRCETTGDINQQIVAGLAGANAQTSEASFVLWVAEEGNYVVRYDFSASGTVDGQPFEWSFVSNITDINNVGSIEP